MTENTRLRKQTWQSRLYYPETLATLGTQDTGQKHDEN